MHETVLTRKYGDELKATRFKPSYCICDRHHCNPPASALTKSLSLGLYESYLTELASQYCLIVQRK